MSHFTLEPRNFAKVTISPAYAKKDWLKATLKEIKWLINIQTFLMDNPDKGDPVILYMDFYKKNIQSNVSIYKLKLIILVRGNLHNKEIIEDTWAPIESMRTLFISMQIMPSIKQEYTN